MLNLAVRPRSNTCRGWIAAAALGLLIAGPAGADATSTEPLDLILIDGQRIAELREQVRSGDDPELAAAVAVLTEAAEKALGEPITAVTHKPKPPSSGNLHDYMSLSPYWWPNPDTEDGLPYVRRDGEVNPERDLYDLPALDTMTNAVNHLAFAYYYTGDERYAQNAVERLRVWFLNEDTRMTPRMRYGQFVPGESDGRKYGIIETNRFRWTPDAIMMLTESDAMTDEDLAGLKAWFDDYKTWLLTSEFGQGELAGPNNHGTWCAVQIALYASFVGDTPTVIAICEDIKPRIAAQYQSDGRQPEELVRTRALEYSDFNNRAMMELAYMGEPVGVDLWTYEADNGGSIRKGIDVLLPYMVGEAEWPYQQTRTPRYDRFAQGLRRAAVGFNDPRYEEAIDRMPLDDEPNFWLSLILPLPADFPVQD